jgi:hypothetical protein
LLFVLKSMTLMQICRQGIDKVWPLQHNMYKKCLALWKKVFIVNLIWDKLVLFQSYFSPNQSEKLTPLLTFCHL